jgi:hypothetical protein
MVSLSALWEDQAPWDEIAAPHFHGGAMVAGLFIFAALIR